MRRLNLEPRIRRLEQRVRLLDRSEADEQLLRRLEAARQRMANYDAAESDDDQALPKAA